MGRTESFFELGGDSISAIRTVSLLRKSGYRCSVSRIMQSMTVREIARHLDRDAHDQAPAQHLNGPVGPLAIVEEFLRWDLPVPEHFNQDVVITLSPTATAHVRSALDAIWLHHDALRAVLRDGELSISTEDALRYEFVEVHAKDDAAVAGHIAELGRTLQPGLDLATGPLLRAGLIQAPGGSTLVLCAHHLVIDVVSWHIVVEDLTPALDAARAHRDLLLPPPTASLRDWSAAVTAAVGALPEEDLAVWDEIDEALLDAQRGGEEPGLADTADPEPVVLSAEDTARLRRVAATYGATIEDLVLAGLSLAVAGQDQRGVLVVQREAHGRHEHPLLPDVSRTVGWFTCIHPVAIVSNTGSLHDAIIAAKEAVRRVPLGGIGYRARPGAPSSAPRPPLALNYIGDHDSAASSPGSTSYRIHAAGNAAAAENHIPVGVQLDAFIADGRLRIFASLRPGADREVVAALSGCMIS